MSTSRGAVAASLALASVLGCVVAVAGCASPASRPGDDDAEAEGVEPAALTAAQVDAWETVAKAGGARPLAEAKIVVVGVRGYDVTSGRHDTVSHQAFDDTFVLLRADGPSAFFSGSTHPFEKKAPPGVPDVDGDGVSDVGMLRPGVYRAKPLAKRIDQAPTFWVNTVIGGGALPAWRDTNHDGVFSDEEREKSEARHDTVTSILFHVGSAAAPKVIGCQVSTRAVLRALAQAAPKGFDYVLVDASAIADVPALQ